MSGFMKSLSKAGNIIPDDIERRRLDNMKDRILERLRNNISNTKLNDRDEAQYIFAQWEACSYGDYDKNSGISKNEKDLIAVRRRMLGREIEKLKEDFLRRYVTKPNATGNSPNLKLNVSEEYSYPTTTNIKTTDSPPLSKAILISDCTLLPDHDGTGEYDGEVVYPVLDDEDGIPVASEVSYESLESCYIETTQTKDNNNNNNNNNNNDNNNSNSNRNADNDRCDCPTFRYFPHRKKKCATRKILYTGGAIIAAGAVLGVGVAVGVALAKNDMIEENHELLQRGVLLEEQHAEEQRVLQQREHDMNLAFQLLQNRIKDIEATERALVERELESQRLDHVFGTLAVTEKTTTTTKKIRPEFDVVFMLDTSGSMAGEKSEEMFTALCEVMKVLKLNDGISITLFNDHILKVLPITKKKRIEFPNCICDSLTRYTPAKLAFICRGGTALWDATNFGLMELAQRPNKRSHPHLVVVTDGDDSCSRNDDFRSIRSKLLNPTAISSQLSDLQVSFITVGNRNEPYVDRIHSLTREPNHLSQIVVEEIHHYHAEKVTDIIKCFRQINIQIEKTVTEYNITIGG